jgi:hypothetical protein
MRAKAEGDFIGRRIANRLKRMERMKTDARFASAYSAVAAGNANEKVTEIAFVKF